MENNTRESIAKFKSFLIEQEKSRATVDKYLRDITAFFEWLDVQELNKSAVVDYKMNLVKKYKPSSVNSVLSSLNGYFSFCRHFDCRVKFLKIQRRIFAQSEKELTKAEYEKLLDEARKRKNERLYLLMQTICSSGIRVSELQFITVDAVKSGRADINCKGKIRQVFLPKALCRLLEKYVKKKKITSGAVFVTRNSKPLDRSSIWKMMKALCVSAGVSAIKVFPHNLRHLFARTFYSLSKDIVRLSDILGHSSINTTRIYTMETGEIHRMQIQKLGLVRQLC